MNFLSQINANWTLFLDRDGVINQRYPDDYVKKSEDFIFTDQAPKAIAILSEYFGKIFVVTNQQGVGKGLMTKADLDSVHEKMKKEIEEAGGRIDHVYVCTDLKGSKSFFRKPNPGMGLQARKEYPQIRFKQAIMVGDTISDMLFGKKLGMKTTLIGEDAQAVFQAPWIQARYDSLYDFAVEVARFKENKK